MWEGGGWVLIRESPNNFDFPWNPWFSVDIILTVFDCLTLLNACWYTTTLIFFFSSKKVLPVTFLVENVIALGYLSLFSMCTILHPWFSFFFNLLRIPPFSAKHSDTVGWHDLNTSCMVLYAKWFCCVVLYAKCIQVIKDFHSVQHIKVVLVGV